MRALLSILIFLLLGTSVNAQKYPMADIPDSLLVNADAVMRYRETVFKQTDINNGTVNQTYVITVLNESGRKHAEIFIGQDKFTELKSFSGTVEDPKSGKVIKKISKSDLLTSAYSSHMASDDKYSMYEYTPVKYPFTIKFEYEAKLKNGIPAYPAFAPVYSHRFSVQQAKYSIQIPENLGVRYKCFLMPHEPKISTKDNAKLYEWELNNFKAIEYEPFAPKLSAISPSVIIAPVQFSMDGFAGEMTDWKSLGTWVAKLQEKRENIPQDLKDKLLDMTKGLKTDKEKVEVVYKYMQSTTRYVSIQLGIGGFQPLSAESVAKSGFGDCKALSNYMKAMLLVIGIPSEYAIISTKLKDIYTDFASLTQMNHAILAVPLVNDTLWLECTSSTNPFNYAHSSIAGHQTVLITANGGKVCRVRSFPEIGDNISSTYTIKLDEEGNATSSVKRNHKLEAYEDMQYFAQSMSREEQINYLAKSSNFSKVKISDLQLLSSNGETPEIQLQYNMEIERVANKSGSRLFIPFSALAIRLTNLKQVDRKQDIVVGSGIVRTDTLNIIIPEKYTPESVPKPTTIDSQFGSYTLKTTLINNHLQIIQQAYIKHGRYPASEYENFRQFFKQIEKESNRRAVFKQAD